MSLFEGLEKLYQVAKRNPGKTAAAIFGTGAAVTAGMITAPVSLSAAGIAATVSGVLCGGAAGGLTTVTTKGIQKLQVIQAQRQAAQEAAARAEMHAILSEIAANGARERGAAEEADRAAEEARRAAEEKARADAELDALIEEEAQASRELEALEQFEREQQAEMDAFLSVEAERDAYYESLAEEYEKVSGPMDRFLQPLSPSYDPFAELNVDLHASPSSSSMMSSSLMSDNVQQPTLTPAFSQSSSSSRHRAKRTSSEEPLAIQNKAIDKRPAAKEAAKQIAKQFKKRRK